MPLRLRIHGLADHPALVPVVAGWQFAEWGETEPGATLEGWTTALAATTRRGAIPTTFVALSDDDGPIGCASLVAHDLATRDDLTPWLAAVFVVPAMRGRGVGKVLVRHAVRAARTMGVPQLFLYTHGAEKFYAALGWQPVAREAFRGRTVTIMAIAPAEVG